MNDFAEVLIADCHVRAGTEKEKDFHAMLEKISALPESCQVIFLGDIFDLWIAWDAYEDRVHKDFLQWCGKEKKKRKIVFIEGNHELYVKRRYAEYFSFVSEREYVEEKVCFCHGDQFNARDWGYRFFRFMLRNSVMYFLAYLTGRNLGPFVAGLVRKIFCCKGVKEERPLPETVLEKFALRLEKRGLSLAIAGHFHRGYLFTGRSSSEILLIPAWERSELVTVRSGDGKYVNMSWKNLVQRSEMAEKAL